MTTKQTIRCSALPLAWSCAASADPAPDGEIRLNLSDEPAECGNAVHRWMAGYVRGVELDQVQLANEHAVDEDELRMLCARGMTAWKELGAKAGVDPSKGDPECSAEAMIAGGVTITGTLDFVQRVERRALVCDYKSGRVDSDYGHQLSGYARLAVEKYGAKNLDGVTVIVVWLRSGNWDITHLDIEQIKSWEEEFSRRLRNGRGNFNPGAHCGYCPRAASCPGRRAMVQSTIADLTAKGLPVIQMTKETRNELGPQIGAMYGLMKLLENLAEQFRAGVKADVIENGPLPIGWGRQLAITEVNRRELNPRFARPVLAKWLTADEIDAETKISASGCESQAVAKAPKGQGAATKRAISAALEEAGAVSINTIQQLREGKA